MAKHNKTTDGGKPNQHDNTSPQGKWNFNKDVANVFTDMLKRSIPDYLTMRTLLFKVAEYFVKPNTRFVDLGCANGLSAEGVIMYHHKEMISYLYDCSEPMLELCRQRYKDYIEEGTVIVQKLDLKENPIGWKHFIGGCSVIMSCLTLQFVPIEYRQRILENVFESLNKGGAFILVEKVLGNSAQLDDLFNTIYYDMKRENQYTEEQISNKRKSLEGVLSPLTEEMNISMLRMAGFRKIDTFWRNLNFCGIIAIKD